MSTLKKYTYWFILLFFTVIGSWIVPLLVKKATIEPTRYPFVYYSSVAKELCIVNYKDTDAPVREITGKVYTTAEQADSVLPLFKYRQLLSEGRFPDSINGIPISTQQIRVKSINYRFSPIDINKPNPGLYIMYESLPKRLGFESPGDVFRLDHSIEFIDIEKNRVNREKSDLFQQALLKEGFTFPAQWVNGNMNPRKPYDEGYFVLDAQNELFHVKMVNGRPFIRNTNITNTIHVSWFEMLEVADKRFYGFLYDHDGYTYIIGNEGGKYVTQRLDIGSIDIESDQLMVLGNLLYWTVSVTNENGRFYYGLETESLERLSEYHVEKQVDKWEKTASYLFAFYIEFQDKQSAFIYPRIQITSFKAYATNMILALIMLLFIGRKSTKRIAITLWVLLFGIPGLLASLLVPTEKILN